MAGRSLSNTAALEDYIVATGTRETEVQRRLRAATQSMRNGGMQIGPDQGQFMTLLAKTTGARNALEIGTFTGYSALAVAAALPPDGKLIACDVSREWTDIGRQYWREAGLDGRIELRLGPAADTLAALIRAGGAGTFDFAFIDADKSSYDRYYEDCLVLVRSGGLILLDNMLWGGAVIDDTDNSADTVALRKLNRKIHDDARVSLSLLPIGDGLTIAHKRR